MARASVKEAVTNLAARLARALRASVKLQPPMRRKALFEAMEQRFLLSSDGVIPPPPPPAQAPAALEAPLNTDAAARLTASSAPVQYTIQGNQQHEAVQATDAALKKSDLSGVTATNPTIVQIDPSLAKVGGAGVNGVGPTVPGEAPAAKSADAKPAAAAASGKSEKTPAAAQVKDAKDDAVKAAAAGAEKAAPTQTAPQILAHATQTTAPAQMSLA
ncbi:MAG: LEPR-XLL domain-containing protein, partial [Burkholderiales bacterium]